MPYSMIERYHCFGGTSCLHDHIRRRPQAFLKHWHLSITLGDAISQKITIWNSSCWMRIRKRLIAENFDIQLMISFTNIGQTMKFYWWTYKNQASLKWIPLLCLSKLEFSFIFSCCFSYKQKTQGSQKCIAQISQCCIWDTWNPTQFPSILFNEKKFEFCYAWSTIVRVSTTSWASVTPALVANMSIKGQKAGVVGECDQNGSNKGD
jgi:hypothetical protein